MVLPSRVERPFTPRSLHRRHPRPILGVVALGTAALVLLLGGGVGATAAGPGTIEVNVDTAKTGATIDRNLFGRFAKHLGTGIYEGVWVAATSPIPKTGIRKDVVAALKALKVPNVRWPGGCFADE